VAPSRKGSLAQYEDLARAFKGGEFESLYLFWGEESYLIDELLRLAVKYSIDEELQDFNYNLLQGDLTESMQAIQACMALPMMDDRRLVVVRRFEQMQDRGGKGKTAWKAYAQRPNPEAVVILTCDTKPKLNTLPYVAIRKHGYAVGFAPLKAAETGKFIRGYVKRSGATIDRDAVDCLQDYVGTSLHSVVGELDKLRVFSGDSNHITKDDVIRATGQSREVNVWNLRDAVISGQLAKAEKIMALHLARSANRTSAGIGLVAMLVSYFSDSCQVSDLMRRRNSYQSIASNLKKSAFMIKRYMDTARLFGPDGLQNALQVLMAADCELKGESRRDVRLILTLMMYQMHQGIAGARGTRRRRS